MSFLPHDPGRALSWYTSLAASTTVHVGIIGFVVFSGTVAFLPEAPEHQPDEQSMIVSLEILDADVISEPEDLSSLSSIPDDAPVLDPIQTEIAALPDDTEALATSDPEMLSPDAAGELTPDTSLLETAETDLLGADALAPETEQEPDVLTQQDPLASDVTASLSEESLPEPLTEEEALVPDESNSDLVPDAALDTGAVEPEPIDIAAEPEVIEDTTDANTPTVTEPEIAEVEPIPEVATLTEPETQNTVVEAITSDGVAATPVAPEQGVVIDSINPVQDDDFNPMAQGGRSVLPTEETLTLATPVEVSPPNASAAAAIDETEALAPVVDSLGPDAVQDDFESPPVSPEVAVSESRAALPVEDNSALAPTAVEDPDEVLALLAPDDAVPLPTPSPETIPAPDETDTTVGPSGAEPNTGPPTVGAPRRIASPSPTDMALGALLRQVRSVSHEQCTVALPRRLSSDGGSETPLAGLSLAGADTQALDDLALSILDGLNFVPLQTREIIDPRQCAVFDAIRQSASYPANRIGLSLAAGTVESGDTLSGSVLGAGGLFVTLLLIDDNGVVQDMSPFITLDGPTPRFDAPVARTGPTRATRQVLLAVGTQGAPLDLSEDMGKLAEDVFANIPAETLTSMVFGIVTFDVR